MLSPTKVNNTVVDGVLLVIELVLAHYLIKPLSITTLTIKWYSNGAKKW